MNAITALKFVAQDQLLMLDFFFAIQERTDQERAEIIRIIERYIVATLEDENGYLIPDALSDEEIQALQDDLVAQYSPDILDQALSEIVGLVEIRINTIDDLMRNLEIEDGILGASVFEMDVVQSRIQSISDGLYRGAFGDEATGYEGSVERISQAMNRYRLDRSKPEIFNRLELIDRLQKDAGAGKSHANSVALTAMAVIDRDLKRVQAFEGGIEHGLYAGTYDDLIRPFCDLWLGQVMTYSFWDNYSNDMPEGLFDFPVSIMCGGINCRHRIIPWRLEWSNGDADLRSRFVSGG